MARGTEIIVSSEPRGVFKEGIISGTPLPGTIMEVDPTVTAPVSGRWQYRVFQPGTTGLRRTQYVLLPDRLQGKLATDAYSTGTRGFLYLPAMGEDLNLLIKGGVTPTFGMTLIVENGSGKLIATTGSPQSEPYLALEAFTNASDALAWCVYTGY